MKYQIRSIVVMGLMIFSTGCMSINIDATGYDKTASLTSTDKNFTIQKHFTRELKSWYVLLNLIPVSQPDFAEILREETTSAHGDAVLNIKIQGQTKLVDAAIPVALSIFGSMISPQRGALAGLLIGVRTYTIEGDVIKYLE